MSLHALKEPIKFVSRSCGGSPPRTRLLQASRRTFSGSSKVLAALDAQTAEDDEDSSIEILGPFPAVSEQQGKNNRTNKSTNPFVIDLSIGRVLKFSVVPDLTHSF